MVTEKMIPAFQKAEGGLFSAVEKADVGDAVAKMSEQGGALMSWADPFYPTVVLQAITPPPLETVS